MRATRAVIHSSNLKFNLDSIRELTGKAVKICLAVKADAYGHGAEGISGLAQDYGVDCLAVAAVSEASELRSYGIELPIILLSPALPEETEDLLKLNIEPVISTEGELDRLSEAAGTGTVRVHLKIDTGMGRIGCHRDDVIRMAERITSSPGLKLSGVCTHFPVSDSTEKGDIEFTKKQIELFRDRVELIRSRGIDPGIIHAANSGGIINYPESHFDMVRPGILAYGYLPGGMESVINPAELDFSPKPVMGFESRLVHIKKVTRGTDISYGRKFTASSETWIGTIPAGYADGYFRQLSNKGKILINGKLYPVAGTVCMDMLMVDLGPEPDVNLYDRAVLFGPDEGSMTAEDLAALIGTISYELTCALSKRVPRIIE